MGLSVTGAAASPVPAALTPWTAAILFLLVAARTLHSSTAAFMGQIVAPLADRIIHTVNHSELFCRRGRLLKFDIHDHLGPRGAHAFWLVAGAASIVHLLSSKFINIESEYWVPLFPSKTDSEFKSLEKFSEKIQQKWLARKIPLVIHEAMRTILIDSDTVWPDLGIWDSAHQGFAKISRH